MLKTHAYVILDLIECSTSGNWPSTRSGLEEMGYNGSEVEEATAALAELAGRSNPIVASDF